MTTAPMAMTTSPIENTFASGIQCGAAQRSTSHGRCGICERGRVRLRHGDPPGVVHRLDPHGHRASIGEDRREVEEHPECDDRHAGDAPVEDGRSEQETVGGDPQDGRHRLVGPPRQDPDGKRDELEHDRAEEQPGRAEPQLGEATDAAAQHEAESDGCENGERERHGATRPAVAAPRPRRARPPRRGLPSRDGPRAQRRPSGRIGCPRCAGARRSLARGSSPPDSCAQS